MATIILREPFGPPRLVCEWCGEEFDRPHIKGPPPKYCRPSHRQRAHEQRHDTDRPGFYEVKRENRSLIKQNRKLQERLNRIDNVMIGNARIWALDRIAMEIEVEGQLVHDEENLGEYGQGPRRDLAIDRYTQYVKDALFIRRLEWDLGELHKAVKGDTARTSGRYGADNWKGPRP